MEQYSGTFMINCRSLQGKEDNLSRKRLMQLRIQDFSKMNIKDFEDAKILMEHIRISLRYEFLSPLRKSAVKQHNEIKGIPIRFDEEDEDVSQEKKPKFKGVISEEKAEAKSQGKKEPSYVEKKKKEKQRRRSFDNQAWQSISQLRTATSNKARDAALERTRAGFFPNVDNQDVKEKRTRTRRWTVSDDSDEPLSTKELAKRYGNMALEFDMIQQEMQLLQKEQLDYYRDVVGCEMATIQFLSKKTDELVMLHDKKWYRHGAHVGFAGDCVTSGDIVHVSDPQQDLRFNKNVDDAFDVQTKNILCYPVRANRGGGAIIGVLSMINKLNDTDFERSDYDILGDCVRKISDELHIRFRELLDAAELLAGNSVYISDKSAKTGKAHHHSDPTKASLAGQYQVKTGQYDPKEAIIPKFRVDGDSLQDKMSADERQARRKSFGNEEKGV